RNVSSALCPAGDRHCSGCPRSLPLAAEFWRNSGQQAEQSQPDSLRTAAEAPEEFAWGVMLQIRTLNPCCRKSRSKVVRKRRVISLTNPSSTRSAGREDQRLLYTELKLTKVCVDNHLSRTYPSRGHPGPGSFAKEDTMSRLGITTFPRAG